MGRVGYAACQAEAPTAPCGAITTVFDVLFKLLAQDLIILYMIMNEYD
jgi:hypothetical protein